MGANNVSRLQARANYSKMYRLQNFGEERLQHWNLAPAEGEPGYVDVTRMTHAERREPWRSRSPRACEMEGVVPSDGEERVWIPVRADAHGVVARSRRLGSRGLVSGGGGNVDVR